MLVVRFIRALMVCLVTLGASDLAQNYYKAAQKAERAGDVLNAYLLYARAAALEPGNLEFAAKKASLRIAANRSAHTDFGPDPAQSPEREAEPHEAAETRPLLSPPRFAPSGEKKSFDLKGDAQSVFEKVGEAYGIKFTFDSDYQSPPQFIFRMNDAGFQDALRALELVSNSFAVALDPHQGLVARDTQAKRNQHVPVVAASIPIPERTSVQDAQEMMTAVQTSLDIRRAQFDPNRHVVILRAEEGKIAAAERLFATLSHMRPQVELDVQFLEVDKTSSLGYGLALPNQLSVVNFLGPVALPAVFSELKELTGSATPYGVGIGNASILATLARASAIDLLDAQILALDGQAATLHVGERYPIATNQYVGNTAGQTGTVYTPPPAITFEDLGLVMKITPSINADQQITLDLESEFKTLGAVSPVAGIPVINNRSYKATVRLQEGEWAVISGLIQLNDSDTRSGYPGLIDVPILGRLFAQNNIEHDSTQVLLVLKPHVVDEPTWDAQPQPPSIWVGTDTRTLTVN